MKSISNWMKSRKGPSRMVTAVALVIAVSLVLWFAVPSAASPGGGTSALVPLTITTTSPLPDGGVGSPYWQQLQASGGYGYGYGGGYTWSRIWGMLPAGLSLDSSGVISGTPTTAATFSFVVKVTDGVSSVTKGLTIKILTRLATLGIDTTGSLPAGDVGTAYSQTLKASGGTGSYTWSKTGGSLPTGLSLNPATGVISGPPTVANTFDFTIQVASGASTVSKDFSIKINPALTITSTSPLPNGHKNVPYLHTLTAGGGSGSYTWSIVGMVTLLAPVAPALVPALHLPVGLSLDPATGVISGTTTDLGLHSPTFQVTDGITAVSKLLSITIDEVLTIMTTSLPDGHTTVNYSQTLHATGGTGNYTWSITVPSLPAGLSINPATGTISGTPTAGGTSNFTVQVEDELHATDTQALSIAINSVLTITTNSLGDGYVGVAYSQTVQATGGFGTRTWTIVGLTLLPPGLSLNSSSGVISGTPTTGGLYHFTVQVTDTFGGSDTQALSIHIDPPVSITTTSLPAASTGFAYSYFLEATGGTGSYTWSRVWGMMPAGLSLNPLTGEISGSPTRTGTFTFVVQVTDGISSATKGFSIKVQAG